MYLNVHIFRRVGKSLASGHLYYIHVKEIRVYARTLFNCFASCQKASDSPSFQHISVYFDVSFHCCCKFSTLLFCFISLKTKFFVKRTYNIFTWPDLLIDFIVFFNFKILLSFSRAIRMEHSNRLGQQKSPYLLQHKNNPIDWLVLLQYEYCSILGCF